MINKISSSIYQTYFVKSLDPASLKPTNQELTKATKVFKLMNEIADYQNYMVLLYRVASGRVGYNHPPKRSPLEKKITPLIFFYLSPIPINNFWGHKYPF